MGTDKNQSPTKAVDYYNLRTMNKILECILWMKVRGGNVLAIDELNILRGC